jgi:DNA replication protein DnaC
MSVDGKLLLRAREALAAQKAENAAQRDQREALAYRRVPALRGIDARLRALVGEVIRVASELTPQSAALERIQTESLALCAEKAELLENNGFPADWLDEIVSCPDCRDSGYLPDGSMCRCLKKRYEEEQAKELSSVLKAGEESFADFSLDYYTGPARECMEQTFAFARRYAVGFGADSPNLLLQGGTGLGKTFLSGCIAKVVAAKGCAVVYETAQDAFGAFEEQKFSRDAETYAAASEKVKRILGCGLLILDDLGTELTTSFTQSALYNIVNTRLTAGKKTLISTNLSDSELAARYLPQTVSRIRGEYETLPFEGRDIREIKKDQRYR